MIKRTIKAIAFASLTAAILLTAFSASLAQSGGASLHGWVAFEDVAYVDKQPRAKVALQHDPLGSDPAYSTETDEHGFFEFPHTSLGRFQVRDHGQRVSTLFRRCLHAVGFRWQLGRAAQGGSTEATVIKQR